MSRLPSPLPLRRGFPLHVRHRRCGRLTRAANLSRLHWWLRPMAQHRDLPPCPALPCSALPCPALPCPALPYPALPCPAPALPCPCLPFPFVSTSAVDCLPCPGNVPPPHRCSAHFGPTSAFVTLDVNGVFVFSGICVGCKATLVTPQLQPVLSPLGVIYIAPESMPRSIGVMFVLRFFLGDNWLNFEEHISAEVSSQSLQFQRSATRLSKSRGCAISTVHSAVS